MSMVAAPRGQNDLAAWLAWQEQAHPKSWDLGLTRISAVWQALGAPRLADYILSIAGTNGKGSCVAWAEAICQAAGVSTASFTSPHLLDYRERIRFDGQMVDAAQLCTAFDAIDVARGEISLSYFEWSALAAFYLMAQKRPQVAILEVGLGGRLDAVNLIDADAVVLTRIGLDHQQWLGETVAEIAAEKAGIMRQGQKIFFADHNAPAALFDAAQALHTPVMQYGRDFSVQAAPDSLSLHLPQAVFADLPLPALLQGAHQYGHFAAVAAALADCLPLNRAVLSQALRQAYNPARLMLKDGRPRYVIDVAHNQDSAEVLAAFLRRIRRPQERFHIVCGMLADKDHAAIVAHLAEVGDAWYFASLQGTRGSDAAEIAAQVAPLLIGKTVAAYEDVQGALVAAVRQAAENDAIVIMGSFVTVTEVLTQWNSNE